MPDIRDIKPPVEIPLYVWVLIALAVAGIIAAAVYFFYRRRKKTVPPPAAIPVRLPWEIASDRLLALSRKKYPEQGMFKPFYSELSDIVRHYLEDRFHIKAPEMTTEEFLNFVKTSAALKVEYQQAFRDFLNGCDMVKFAKHEPTVNEAQANFDLTVKLVEDTKDGI